MVSLNFVLKKEHSSDTVCSKIFPIFEKERSFVPFKLGVGAMLLFKRQLFFLLQTVSELRSFFAQSKKLKRLNLHGTDIVSKQNILSQKSKVHKIQWLCKLCLIFITWFNNPLTSSLRWRWFPLNYANFFFERIKFQFQITKQQFV